MKIATDLPGRNPKNQKKPIWSWRHAIELADIPALSKLLAFVLSNDLSDSGKFTQRPVEELAAAAGMSKRSVENHRKKLVEAGLLHTEVVRNKSGHNVGRRWFPCFPSDVDLDRHPASQSASDAVGDESLNESGSSLNESGSSLSARGAEHITFPNTFPNTSPNDSCSQQAVSGSEEEGEGAAPKGGLRMPPVEPEERAQGAGTEPKVRRAAGYSDEFEAFWVAYRKASPRSPGSKQQAFSAFKRLSAVKRKMAFDRIAAYMADCKKDVLRNGESRAPVDAVRYLNRRWFEQVDEEPVPNKDAEILLKRRAEAEALSRHQEEMA